MAKMILEKCLTQAINEFSSFYKENTEKVNNYIKALKESGDYCKHDDLQNYHYKDFETRLSWDLARATKWNKWDCFDKDEFGYPIVEKDSHLTTLFKTALRMSNIMY